MRRETRPFDEADDLLLAGVSETMRGLLLQLLLYKSVFMGASFRELAEREEPPELREALLMLHVESAAEAVGLTLALREWDAHPAGDATVEAAAAEARTRLIDDIISLKDSVVDLGLACAMRAPTDALRRRLVGLADIDRRHADTLRRLRGATPVEARKRGLGGGGGPRPLGSGAGRVAGEPFARTLERTIDALRDTGAQPTAIVLGPDGLRHARDEGAVDPATGRAFGLPIEIDAAWQGECFAIETAERIGLAELITASRARPEDTRL